MTELQFVTFEQAKTLKELGFPQDMIGGYYSEICKPEVRGLLVHKIVVDTMYASPSLELVAKWLREEKNIYIFVNMSNPSMTDWSPNNIFTYDYSNGGKILIRNQGCYDSYESALSASIDKAIKILKGI